MAPGVLRPLGQQPPPVRRRPRSQPLTLPVEAPSVAAVAKCGRFDANLRATMVFGSRAIGLLTLGCSLLVANGVLAAEDDASAAETTADTSNESAAPTVTAKAATSSDEATAPEDAGYPHGGQFSFRLGLVGAERIISRYDSSPTCGTTDAGEPKKFCGFGAPLMLDMAIGFAPFSALEPFAWARFGLTQENRTHTSPLVVVGGGARIYTSSDSAFKFFLQPAVGLELESHAGNRAVDNKDYKQDFLVQLLAGPQFDFSKNVGAYASFGLTAGMMRAIQTWLEASIGLQARY